MAKYTFICLATLASLLIASVSYAQYCGGNIQYSSDLTGNSRPWNVSCCPTGYRVQGIACADLPPKQDFGDGCSAICRSISKGNIMQPANDFQRHPALYQCDKTEVLAGIVCRDSTGHGGGSQSDVADSCTAVCQKPGSKNLRVVYNNDFNTNAKSAQNRVVTYLPTRVVGIACKDQDKGTSDRLDGCTIITK